MQGGTILTKAPSSDRKEYMNNVKDNGNFVVVICIIIAVFVLFLTGCAGKTEPELMGEAGTSPWILESKDRIGYTSVSIIRL
jgi:hypothetical protein